MHGTSLGPARRLVAALALALTSVPAATARADVPGAETKPTEVPRFGAAYLVVPQSRAYAAGGAGEAVSLKAVAASAVVEERTATVTLEVELASAAPESVTAELLAAVPRRSTLREVTLADGSTVKARMRRGKTAAAFWTAAARRAASLEPLEFAASDAVQTAPVAVSREHPTRVRIAYETALADAAERVDFTLPRSGGPAAADVDWSVSVKVHETAPVATVFSPSHEVSTERKGESEVAVTVGGGAIAPGPVSLSFLLGGSRPVATFFTFPDPKADGGYFLMVGAMPNGKAERHAPMREVLFVVDRSGSMGGEKIEQAKRALLKSIRAMRDGEAFNIVDFASDVRSFASQPVLKNADSATRAEQYVAGIRAGGGTNLNDALVRALHSPPTPSLKPHVLFVTDGMATEGVVDEFQIRANARAANVFRRQIHTVGIGNDVNAPLLAALAETSGATSTFVKPGEDVESVLAEVFHRTGTATLAKARVEAAPGGLLEDVYPAQLGDLQDGEEFAVVGRYLGSGSVPVQLAGEAGGQAAVYDFMIDPTGREDAFVARAWAYRKAVAIVRSVADAGAEDAAPAELSAAAAELVRLAVEHGTLTDVTGFLVESRSDLSDRDELTHVVYSSLARVASEERFGARAIGQTLALRQQQRQVSSGVAKQGGQPICYVRDTSLVKRDQKWVDLRLLARGAAKADSVVRVDSAGLDALRDALVKQRRCGVFAFANAFFEVDGKAVEITATAAPAAKR
jgi:Ca-activated chloride channel family protein